MKRFSAPLISCALLLPLAGCPLLQVEAEVPEVCIARTGVAVPGTLAQLQTKVTVQLHDIEALDQLEQSDELRFVSFAAHPQGGGRPFDGIASAKVILTADASAGLEPLIIFSCAGDCAQADGSLALELSGEDDIAAYLRASGAAAQIELDGALPPTDFQIDIDACLSGELSRSL